MDITTIFWDIGGVVLTNGWEKFALDRDDYGQRHAMAITELETGQITLNE